MFKLITQQGNWIRLAQIFVRYPFKSFLSICSQLISRINLAWSFRFVIFIEHFVNLFPCFGHVFPFWSKFEWLISSSEHRHSKRSVYAQKHLVDGKQINEMPWVFNWQSRSVTLGRVEGRVKYSKRRTFIVASLS